MWRVSPEVRCSPRRAEYPSAPAGTRGPPRIRTRDTSVATSSLERKKVRGERGSMRNAGRAEKTKVGEKDIRGQRRQKEKRGSAKIEREQESGERETPNVVNVYISKCQAYIIAFFTLSCYPHIVALQCLCF